MSLVSSLELAQKQAVTDIAELIRDAGGRALLVGGVVRDGLLGITAKDIDMEVYGIDATSLEAILSKQYRLDTVGRSFGVFILKGLNIDISLPRRESQTGPKHTDFIVEGDPSMSSEEAAARRDFTINAISYDPLTETISDPYNGQKDLNSKTLRHVSPAFSEDPLRVLRGMQFTARFNLTATDATIAICSSLSPADLPPERIWEEWKKLLLKGHFIGDGLRFLQACGWLQYFPELAELVGCEQDPKWHPEGDVWTHTCHCLDAFAVNRISDDWEDLIVGLAVLCHDMGKPATTYTDENGRIRSPRHDIEGVAVAQCFLERMTRQKKVYEEVLPLVEQHMRPLALYRDQAGDSAIRRLAARVKRLDRLVRVSFADKNGRPPLVITDFPEGDWIMQRAESLSIQDSAPKPILLGRHLKSFAIAPGPQYSQILDHCYEAQLEGAFTDIQEGRIYLRSYMETLGIVMS
jgi:tRNA nucleotidyltransferase (CCA-adding enzyme)